MTATDAPSPQRPEPDRSPAATGWASSMLLVLAALLAEAGLAVAAFRGQIGWHVLLAAHVAVVVLLALAVRYRARSGGNTAMPLLAAIAVAAVGPIGALAALLTMLLARPGRDDPRRLAEWYERIALAGDTDAATQLCEDVASGRTADLTGSTPHSFAAVMEHGTLDDRQAALGIIARTFDPSYLPALKLALRSPEPMIRVQAAAVATRIRGNLRALIDTHAGIGRPAAAPSRPAAALIEIDEAIASGLLDEGDLIRARVVRERLQATLAAPVARGRHQAVVPVIDRAAHEQMLLASGRYAELRVGRRIAALADAGLYRIRRPQRRSAGRP